MRFSPTFTNNSANLDGGALFLKACLPNRTMHWSLAEATISGNFAQLRGGGVYCESDSTLLGWEYHDIKQLSTLWWRNVYLCARSQQVVVTFSV